MSKPTSHTWQELDAMSAAVQRARKRLAGQLKAEDTRAL